MLCDSRLSLSTLSSLRADPIQAAITVCHSLPFYWATPASEWFSCEPCPPIGYSPAYAIGRTMAETFK